VVVMSEATTVRNLEERSRALAREQEAKGDLAVGIEPRPLRFTAKFQMPIARQRGICQASNAFSVSRFVSNVFLDATRGPRQRCFSSKATLYTATESALKDESVQQVRQVRYVFDENNAFAASFNPIQARAARRTLARQNVDAKLQACLDPTSLEKTLEKHRAVNMGALIHRVPVDKNAGDFKRPSLIARRMRRRKPSTTLSEENNAHKEGLEIEEHGLLRDVWFEHLDVSSVPEAGGKKPKEKADKIIKSKLNQKRKGFVLEYEGRYVNPISKAKLDGTKLPWDVAVNEAATASERYDQTQFM
jgi:hypothetical protein